MGQRVINPWTWQDQFAFVQANEISHEKRTLLRFGRNLKTTGNYVNSSLAKVEALKAGYDEAIMLNRAGLISECTGENIFVVKDGVIRTPPLSTSILPGITRDVAHVEDVDSVVVSSSSRRTDSPS